MTWLAILMMLVLFIFAWKIIDLENRLWIAEKKIEQIGYIFAKAMKDN